MGIISTYHLRGQIFNLKNALVVYSNWHNVNCLPCPLHTGQVRLQKPHYRQVRYDRFAELSTP